ncbi:MAG TPA: hypothetical protein VJH23_01495 [archaeon]|nr:hypothetical protein [archaeon]
MDRTDIQQALKYARELSKKRKFEQSVEFTMNFKGIDFKKAENRIEVDVKLPHATGKKADIRTLVFVTDSNFAEEIKNKVNRVIMENEIAGLKKKDADILMRDYDVFLAQGPSILAVAKQLGQQLAPKGRMPRPITPSVSALEQSLKSVSTYTKVSNKKGKFMPVIHFLAGKETAKDDAIVENIMEVYSSVLNVLPTREGNVKSLYVKLTMGRPIKVGEKLDASHSQWHAQKPDAKVKQ